MSQNAIVEGDHVQTGDNSYVKIQFSGAGAMELHDRTIVALSYLGHDKIVARLQNGVIDGYFLNNFKSFSIADPPIIEVHAGDGILSASYGAFKIQQDAVHFEIQCFTGLIKYKNSSGEEFYLGRDYTMERVYNRESIPVNKNASINLKTIIIPGNLAALSGELLKSQLQFATTSDLLTLWHLLRYVDEARRENCL